MYKQKNGPSDTRTWMRQPQVPDLKNRVDINKPELKLCLFFLG